jgi:thioredoxin 1
LQVLMFGANWCAHCQAAQTPTIDALADYPNVTLMQIEDGKGRPLGRSYSVKLWPTLIFLKNGQEVDRLVRPTQAAPIEDALVKLTAA